MIVSEKMADFARRSSWIRKMFEEGIALKKLHGADRVCDFSLGNPDLPPPGEFNRCLAGLAGKEVPGAHAYMANAGYPETRDIVAARVGAEQGVAVDGASVIMTCGAAGGLNVALKAILNPGDEVIIIAPYFVEYGFYIDNHGGRAVVVESAGDFDLDCGKIAGAISERTRALIINSPNNPSGQVYPAHSLEKLAQVLAAAEKEHGRPICLISDEPYRRIVYDGVEVPPIMGVWPHSIVANSFSKELSIPGERVGYLAVSPAIADYDELIGAMILANRILGFVNSPALMQRVIAGIGEVTADFSHYRRRREIFCKILEDGGLEFIPPQGGFYIFPRSPLDDEVAFCNLLRDEKILAVPGRGFGSPGYFRLAFCVEDEVIRRSAEGFKRAVARALSS